MRKYTNAQWAKIQNAHRLSNQLIASHVSREAEEHTCNHCNRNESPRYGFKCETNRCHQCGDTYQDCAGSCNNGCDEQS